MANRTGLYEITLTGSRTRITRFTAKTLTAAVETGQVLQRDGLCQDFQVRRVLYDSRYPAVENYDVRQP